MNKVKDKWKEPQATVGIQLSRVQGKDVHTGFPQQRGPEMSWEDPEDQHTKPQAVCAATPEGSNTSNSKLHSWDDEDVCYDSELDEHKGGVIPRQLICQLNCFLVSKGKQMNTHTHDFIT